MLLTSRSYEDYAAFFDLDANRLPARILDCCAGASSFVAGACAGRLDAVAADPAYAEDERTLAEAATAGASGGRRLIAQHQDRFSYAWYGTAERRDALRAGAAKTFREHRHRQPGRYVAASPRRRVAARAAVRRSGVPARALLAPAVHVGRPLRRTVALGQPGRAGPGRRRGPRLPARAAGQRRTRPVPAPAAAAPARRLRHQQPDLLGGYEFQVGAHHMLTLSGP